MAGENHAVNRKSASRLCKHHVANLELVGRYFLDASRAAVRDKRVTLPRRVPLVELFAQHMACDAKVLEEDAETGVKRFRYVRTGDDHFSLAFTYAWMAATKRVPHWGLFKYVERRARELKADSGPRRT